MMRIAYISFEFPPDTAIGGIASYTEQAALLMAERGHSIEVFSASSIRSSSGERFSTSILVHRILLKDRDRFYSAIVEVFAERHRAMPFDLVECPEYSYEGLGVKEKFPNLPMVIRFHTPRFWVKSMNRKFEHQNIIRTIKQFFGKEVYHKEKDKEYLFAKMVEAWVIPCFSMQDILKQYWGDLGIKTRLIPNPFKPENELLEIPVETDTGVITFIGRLELRKGVTQLAKAIPKVLQEFPNVHFQFIGKPNHDPDKKGMMDEYLKRELHPYLDHISFISQIERSQIPKKLAQTDICVFPSYWELFGYVCVEAMAAARGIVASKEGGMNDMLADISGGILIDPEEPTEIANAIIYLLENPHIRKTMGNRSRKKAAEYYSHKVVEQMESFYEEVIMNKQSHN